MGTLNVAIFASRNRRRRHAPDLAVALSTIYKCVELSKEGRKEGRQLSRGMGIIDSTSGPGKTVK
jgi:hypothetical protein